jgi:hypothetical protein
MTLRLEVHMAGLKSTLRAPLAGLLLALAALLVAWQREGR